MEGLRHFDDPPFPGGAKTTTVSPARPAQNGPGGFNP